MKLLNSKKFAFITLGVAALNVALMANGIETMPSMWLKEVYQDPMLGAELLGLTGIALGGVAGAAKEVVKSSIASLREKFVDKSNSPKFSI